MVSESQLRADIVEIGRRMYARRYTASNDGNISVRLGPDRLLMTPKSVCKGFMTADMMCITDLDGRKLQGDRDPSSEMLMHLEVYRQRTDVQAELALTIPHLCASNRRMTERRALATKIRTLACLERHPVAHELLDLHRHAAEVLENRAQAFSIARMANQRAGVKELGQIRHPVARAKRLRRQPGERPDVDGEAVLIRPVVIDVRLRLRPCAVEQREESMVEDVEEPAQRRIAGMTQSLACVLGNVQRERTVRSEQSEEAHLQPRASVASRRER